MSAFFYSVFYLLRSNHYTLNVELSYLPPQAPAHSSPSLPHQWAPTHVLEVTLPTPVSLAQVLLLV